MKMNQQHRDARLDAIIEPFSDTEQQVIQLWAEGLAKILPLNISPRVRSAIFAYAAGLSKSEVK
jgi:hypothetical protein